MKRGTDRALTHPPLSDGGGLSQRIMGIFIPVPRGSATAEAGDVCYLWVTQMHPHSGWTPPVPYPGLRAELQGNTCTTHVATYALSRHAHTHTHTRALSVHFHYNYTVRLLEDAEIIRIHFSQTKLLLGDTLWKLFSSFYFLLVCKAAKHLMNPTAECRLFWVKEWIPEENIRAYLAKRNHRNKSSLSG